MSLLSETIHVIVQKRTIWNNPSLWIEYLKIKERQKTLEVPHILDT